nr:TIGR03557 family F420-dependent LLM class oxidoreductase [Candidatus Njordarchaeum guaymaensis]
MTLILGYKTCHEQYQPDKLLSFAIAADKHGYDTLWTSDHFHPWAHTNAASGFAWTWIASAAERTRNMTIGTSVTAPILRYHPAIVAQAFATLGYMYPNRIFLGLGAGEALNESPLGYAWPSPRERVEMLREALVVIKKLWSEDFVSFEGKYYRLKKANLYTKPPNPLKLYIATAGTKVAEITGEEADGILLIDTGERAKQLMSSFERGARRAGRDPSRLEKVAEVMVSYDEDYKTAVKSVRFWAGSMLPIFYKCDVSDPREIEVHGEFVGDEVLEKAWIIGTTAEQHLERIEDYMKTGFNHLYFCSSSPNERKFIKFYGEKILPYLRETYGDN